MNYKEMFDKAISAQKAVVMNVAIHEWKEEGEALIGRLTKFEEFEGGEYDKKCQVYTFETDNGKESCVLGSVGDKILAADANVGKIFAITFNGKRTTKKGKECNDFQILMIPEGK
jgi:hypothetical protein